MSSKSRALLPLALCLSLVATACATNPATGRTELNFYTEEQEIAMGREAHEEILAEFGVYDEKPHLNELVDRIGHGIAAKSPRPNLPWTFTLLDTPMVNAMALPGGYVYVTRGIMERLNSEDELAGVIGHEVAHVAARHSTHAMSAGTMAQIGVVAAAVILADDNADAWATAGLIGAGLLFTKYSRQQETEADILGTKYMASTGYNPLGSENMLMALERLGGAPNGWLERYFMDHPDPKKRVQDVRREIATLHVADATIGQRAVDRNKFVQQLDGMLTGNATSHTVIRDGVVYNRSYGVVARPRSGWRPVIESGSLFALYRENGEEVVYAQELTADELKDVKNPRQAVRKQLEEMGVEHVESFEGRTATGERVTVDLWEGESEGTNYTIETATHRAGSGAVVLMHIAQLKKGSSSLLELLEDVELDSADAASIKPPRLRVMTARKGDTWESLAKRATGDAEDADDIAHINGFDFPSEVPVGLVVKLPEEVAQPHE